MMVDMRFAVLFLIPAALAGQKQLTLFESSLESGKAAVQQSRYQEATRHLRLAIEQADKLEPPDPLSKAKALDALCDLDLLIGKYDDAVPLAEAAAAALDTTATAAALAPHLMRLAGAYRAAGRTPDAAVPMKRALALDIEAEGPNGERATADYDALGSSYVELKRYADARAAYNGAMNARVERLGGDHLELATVLLNLASVEERDKQPKAARADYERALAISEKKLGEESYSLTGILDRLGLMLRREKRYGESEPVLQRSLSIREKSLGARHSDVAPALDNLALTYFFDNKFAEAEPLFIRSLQIWQSTQGPDSPLVALALDNLGALYSAQQRYAEAEPLFRRGLAIRERQDLESLSNLALLYESTKDVKDADAFYQRALLIGEKPMGGQKMEVGETLQAYATFLRANGRIAEAAKVEARLKELRAAK